MKVSDFDFELPEELIASQPLPERDASRLLHVTGDGMIEDHFFCDLTNFVRPNDILVFNDSKVIPARLFASKGDANIELLLHKREYSPLPIGEVDGHSETRQGERIERTPLSKSEISVAPSGRANIWRCFAKPGRKCKVGDVLEVAEGFTAEVLQKHETGEITLQFDCHPEERSDGGSQSIAQDSSVMPQNDSIFYSLLEKHGHMPLPPYMKREDEASDKERYQTVYAREEGSVAAPTAGLHFTETVLEKLKSKGVELAYVTLHVGAGTFQPVKVEDTGEHVMHSEYAVLTQETAEKINAAKARGGRVIAVGTTAMRTLESAATPLLISPLRGEKGHVSEHSGVEPFAAETDIFITPGYAFKMVDCLLTNFHLPKSTLFMLVSAFSGLEAMQCAYQHAIDQKYRFYSYGDACFLEKTRLSS